MGKMITDYNQSRQWPEVREMRESNAWV